ncbi:RepA [Rhodobacter phage RcCronus]|uniref:Replication initiator protein A n=2 Tax=Cronusvirus cronus TaxID=2005060 RepID=A0A0K1LM20_9CAUD|nr:replication initiation protein [Rhodobacter phage RcRhea]YP_009616323.1 replication initiation protein [Rhodobacter phage RcCronus]AKU43278.1 replication initiator protein A [Rhodobacter phage RcRhea]AKU43322.1 RepA [Rhodobacter phage RcCronus]
MTAPLTLDKHPQADLFLFDVVSAPIKDLVDTLEHPFYSLSKKPEMQTRVYRHGDVKIEMVPSRKGLPTIYDKDLLIYAVSKVAASIRHRQPVGPTIEMPSAEILQFTNRGTSGREYRALEDALERLAGTLIKTTLRAKGGGKDVAMFHLVEIATIGRRGRLGVTGCTIRLPDWIFQAIEANAILTLHPDYFRLRRPLEKRLYELGRKHCGQQPRWQIGLAALHNKAGARGAIRNFRGAVKRLAETDHLPDYHVTLDPDADLVAFRPRKDAADLVIPATLPPLSPHAIAAAKAAAPGADVYALESEWRAWAGGRIASGDAAPPADADLAFLGFIKARRAA